MNCSRCGKEFENIFMDIELQIQVKRRKESDIWESVKNLDNFSREALCEDCFDLFIEAMEIMNKKYGEAGYGNNKE